MTLSFDLVVADKHQRDIIEEVEEAALLHVAVGDKVGQGDGMAVFGYLEAAGDDVREVGLCVALASVE